MVRGGMKNFFLKPGIILTDDPEQILDAYIEHCLRNESKGGSKEDIPEDLRQKPGCPTALRRSHKSLDRLCEQGHEQEVWGLRVIREDAQEEPQASAGRF